MINAIDTMSAYNRKIRVYIPVKSNKKQYIRNKYINVIQGHLFHHFLLMTVFVEHPECLIEKNLKITFKIQVLLPKFDLAIPLFKKTSELGF